MRYTDEQKIEAKKLFIEGAKVPEIVALLGIPKRTLYDWSRKESWGTNLGVESTEYKAHQRLQWMIDNIDEKSEQHLQEMDFLKGMILDFENQKLKRWKAENGGGESSGGGGKKKKRKSKNNDFSHLTEQEILDFLYDGLFDYQIKEWENRLVDMRFILKSRQIGMTFYFAKEAFADALLRGHNKVFISASRAQVGMFRRYIKAFARQYFDVEIKGTDEVELITPNGTCYLNFLSTNADTAQSYNGDLYIDEQFWINNYHKLEEVASAMASHDKWSSTYFSTPSTKSHQAYAKWSGKEYEDNCKAWNEPVEPWPSDKELEQGVICPDGAYRRIITIETAEKEGCTLFNIEKLKRKYSKDKFDQLFMCKFIDDTESVFKFSQLMKCAVDPTNWKDVEYGSETPYFGPVWIGYDPSRTRDDACIVVAIPPKRKNGKFRIIEKLSLKNCKWKYQANYIRKFTEKYNVAKIVIDITGPGSGVFEMVQEFYPEAIGVFFTNENKNRMILKAESIIEESRVEWNVEWTDIASGFLQIKKTVSGDRIVYKTERSKNSGHGDAAWATILLFDQESLTSDGGEDDGRSFEYACA